MRWRGEDRESFKMEYFVHLQNSKILTMIRRFRIEKVLKEIMYYL